MAVLQDGLYLINDPCLIFNTDLFDELIDETGFGYRVTFKGFPMITFELDDGIKTLECDMLNISSINIISGLVSCIPLAIVKDHNPNDVYKFEKPFECGYDREENTVNFGVYRFKIPD